MIQALIAFLIIVVIVCLLYWVITKLLKAATDQGIALPPILGVVVQIVAVVVIVVAFINLLLTMVGMGVPMNWPRRLG